MSDFSDWQKSLINLIDGRDTQRIRVKNFIYYKNAEKYKG